MTTEPWVSVEDAAKLHGDAEGSVRRGIEAPSLPAHETWRLWKFRLSGFDAWVRTEGASEEPTRGAR